VSSDTTDGTGSRTSGAASVPETTAPPPANAAFLAMTLGRRIREQIDGRLREQDISLRHLSALGHLHREPGISYSELARRAHVTAQSMQATLQQLEQRGAVERRTPAGRGHRAELYLTVEGQRLRDTGRHAIADANTDLLTALPAESHAGFVELLNRALQAMDGSPKNSAPPR
jgi:DNA-binding MarR family transcriptional regulator